MFYEKFGGVFSQLSPQKNDPPVFAKHPKKSTTKNMSKKAQKTIPQAK